MKYFDRKILHEIIKFLDYKEAILIFGARQVGKTTVMKMIMKYLKNNNIGENAIFYFDLENLNYLQLFDDGINNVIKYIEARTLYKGKIYIFIDEIQYLNDPTNLIKLAVDHYSDRFKLIISGSSALSMKTKIRRSLVGRIITFEMFGLDFEEFLLFNGLEYNLSKVEDNITAAELIEKFKEFIIFGGYPRIALIKMKNDKIRYLKEFIQTYIRKDVGDLVRIGNIIKFNNLLRVLASQSGNLLNMDEISSTLRIAKETLYRYISLLEGTYITKRLPPFYRNIRSELTKMPKIYFEDNGILNYLRHNDIIESINGQSFENAVYSEFRKHVDFNNLKYWRTQVKQEVDFIVERKGKLLAFEVKLVYTGKKLSALKYFLNKYSNSVGYVITLDKNGINENYDNIDVIFPWEAVREKL